MICCPNFQACWFGFIFNYSLFYKFSYSVHTKLALNIVKIVLVSIKTSDSLYFSVLC